MVVIALCTAASSPALAAVAGPLWPEDVLLDGRAYDQGVAGGHERGLASASDGAGGMIAVWDDDFGSVISQRLSPEGARLWATEGVPVALSGFWQNEPRAIADGAGGAIVAWLEGRSGYCVGGSAYFDCDVYAQRLDADGKPLWHPSGVAVVIAPGNQGPFGLELVSDGAGGAILLWIDGYEGHRIAHAQRIDGSGARRWDAAGVVLGERGAHGIALVADGAGGALAFRNPGGALWVDRLDADGGSAWPQGSLQITEDGWSDSLGFFAAVADGAGGAIVAVEEEIAYSVRRVRADRALDWQGQPPITPPLTGGPASFGGVPDGAGGAFLAWQYATGCMNTWHGEDRCNVIAQRIDASGAPQWPNELAGGLRLDAVVGGAPVVTAAPGGGAIVVWHHCHFRPQSEPACSSQLDLFAQRLDPDGERLWGPHGALVSAAPANQGMLFGASELPASFTVVGDDAGGAFVAWPDGRNGFCQVASVGSNCDVYAQRVPEPRGGMLAAVTALLALARGARRSSTRAAAPEPRPRRRSSPRSTPSPSAPSPSRRSGNPSATGPASPRGARSRASGPRSTRRAEAPR